MMEVHMEERRGGGEGVKGKVVGTVGGAVKRGSSAPGAPSPAGSVSPSSLEAQSAGLEGS